MRALKFEWREGPHGVESLKIVGERGTFTFEHDASSGFGVGKHLRSRTVTLDAVRSLAEEIVMRHEEGHHTPDQAYK